MTFSLPEKKTVPEHQADAYLSQNNPVSGTWYTVLDTTKNVRIISMNAKITWATTQPTPLEIRVTVDGNVLTFGIGNPVSDGDYMAKITPQFGEGGQYLDVAEGVTYRAFLLEGRSVKVEVRITWATTQPTPLRCRVKYAKY
jgi:hypothetical protein